jgi:hypothetical protein
MQTPNNGENLAIHTIFMAPHHSEAHLGVVKGVEVEVKWK